MRRIGNCCTGTVLLAVLLLVFSMSVGAEIYDPDGVGSEEYLFDAASCDRTFVLNCVDESGTLVKQVSYRTQKGADELISFALYGYDLVAFESDQGLWEKCKITWCTGINAGRYLYIQIEYAFRSGLSRDVLTATATIRKAEPITVVQRHYLEKMGVYVNASHYVLDSSKTTSVSYYDPVSWQAQIPTGYHMAEGYLASFDGAFTYKWLGKSKNLPFANFEYDWINTPWSEDMGSYSSYNEAKDGKVDYCTNRVLYVDFYYDLDEYTISFDANGGEDAPDNVIKKHGYDVVLPSQAPKRKGYFFNGWGTEAEALEAVYEMGATYSQNASQLLYAVWEKDDYEFSISNFAITEEDLFPNSILSVWLCTDSWDENDAYTDIPVELFYDGLLLKTELVDFETYGRVYITFQVDVGTVTGEHEIMVQINRTGIEREENQENNTVRAIITVKEDEYAFGITVLTGNAPYTEGIAVTTSYLISNDSARSVLPDAQVPVQFTAYFYDESGESTVITEQVWEGLAIPSGEQNLVYFKWTIPDGMAGKQVYCACSVNQNSDLKENNKENNAVTLVATIAARGNSQTPNPVFTINAPSDYAPKAIPDERVGSASWTVWEYENGAFVLKTYGIKLMAENPEITPDPNCSSATNHGDVWTMRSGYGIALHYTPVLVGFNGTEMPTVEAYTEVQTVRAYFLEYGYSEDEGEYRDLVWYNGEWCFAENDNGGRLHYIPLWLTDGEYVVSVVLTDVWTPVGCITAVRSSNGIVIDGSLYDDWYN